MTENITYPYTWVVNIAKLQNNEILGTITRTWVQVTLETRLCSYLDDGIIDREVLLVGPAGVEDSL